MEIKKIKKNKIKKNKLIKKIFFHREVWKKRSLGHF
jgi:hypothetical protein